MRGLAVWLAMGTLLLLGGAAEAAASENPFERELDEASRAVADQAQSPAAVAPLFALTDLEDRVSWTRWEGALREAVARLRDPLARAQGEWALARVEDRQGKLEEANERRRALGMVERWQIVGPFPNENGAAMAMAHPPERESSFDAARVYPVGDRQIGWRAVEASRGLLWIGAFLRPDHQAIAYAETGFELDAAARVAVRLASTGPVQAWIDGVQVISREAARPITFDQDVGALALGAGRHRLLVKVGVTAGPWALLARLTRPDGAPLELRAITASRLPSGRHGRQVRAASLGDRLSGQALGEYLAHVAPEDPRLHQAQQVLAEACARKESARCLLRVAELAPSGERLSALERAIEVATQMGDRAGLAQALVAMGDLYAGSRDREAERVWRRALREDPGLFPAACKLGELWAGRGLGAAAERLVAERYQAAPEILRLATAYAQLLGRRGKRAEAERVLEPLSRLLPYDPVLMRERYGAARGRGDATAALAVLGGLVEMQPAELALALDRAALLEGTGRTAEAEAALRQASERIPEEPVVWEKLGLLLARAGRTREAIAALGRSLELRPQQPELRAQLERMSPERKGGDLAVAFRRPIPTLLAAAAGRSFPGEARAVLLDQKVTRVHRNGLTQTFVQRVVRILDRRGARQEMEQEVRYTPDTQSVEIRAARVWKSSGEVWDASGEEDRSVSEPWYGLYYDLRALTVRLDRLEPGDVIDFQYVVEDIGRQNLMADTFGDLHYFQEEAPRLEAVYAILAPLSRPLHFNEVRLPRLATKIETRGNERYYEWRATEVPKIDLEPGMPGWSEVSAFLHVSTFKDWDEVAAFYAGLARDQLTIDRAMRAAVARAIEGATDELAKVRAIHGLVVRSTRYVGLELGIHGFKPYRTTDVWERKFGDCKDKAALLLVLLREIGVDSQLVLVRTRRNGTVGTFPGSLAIFDHAILYVPKHDLWLDGTAEFGGTRELPAQDQDVEVLRIERGRGIFQHTPLFPAQSNRAARQARLRLLPSGVATVTEALVIEGQAAPEWRRHYQASGERHERYEKAWNERLPGIRLERVEMAHLTELERPVEVSAQGELAQLGRAVGAGRAWPALAHESELGRLYARLSERKYDLALGYPWQQEERYEVELPEGWRVQRLPEPRSVQTPFGTFELRASARGRTLVVEARLGVTQARISRTAYPGFRKFLLEVDAAANQEVRVGP